MKVWTFIQIKYKNLCTRASFFSKCFELRWRLSVWERERQRERERQTDRQTETEFVCLFGFLTSLSTTRLYRGRAPRQSVWQFYVPPHMRQSWETMTSVSAGHIILTPTQPVGSGRPQRESNPGPPHQESRAVPGYRSQAPYFRSLVYWYDTKIRWNEHLLTSCSVLNLGCSNSGIEQGTSTPGVARSTWHRGKLPFEIPNFAKFCHKNLKNLPHFAIKIDKFWKLSVLIGELFIVPGGPEYYIDKKGPQKFTQVHIRKKKEYKHQSNTKKRVPKNLQREASKCHYTKYPTVSVNTQSV